jgi:hypothetical protein
VFGGSVLDLREATLADGVSELSVRAIFGGVQIIVPPTLAVEVDGTAILGGVDHVERTPVVPDPERPVLRVTAFAALGGVEVVTRLPGESDDAYRTHHGRRHLASARESKRLPR